MSHIRHKNNSDNVKRKKKFNIDVKIAIADVILCSSFSGFW